MPLLVTQLPERRALIALVQVALRHEVAELALLEPPRASQAHTLELHVQGERVLRLRAEPVGGSKPHGRHSLRLHPAEVEQTAELYALLEREYGGNLASSSGAVESASALPSDRSVARPPPSPAPTASVVGPPPPRRAPRPMASVGPLPAPSPVVPKARPAARLSDPTPLPSWEDEERAPWDEPDDFATLVRSPESALALLVAEDHSAEGTRRRAPSQRPASIPPPTSEEAFLGRALAGGKYVIESRIGSGGAGVVYKAKHRDLRRTVAVKVLHPHYQHDAKFMTSFHGEALAASQLDHPNILRVLDFGQEPDGLVYLVMEYLSGRTLQDLLLEIGHLAPDRAAAIMMQVCAALSVAHDNGIIHRDIKPDNIMLVTSRDDEGSVYELVKVCDFGIAALQTPRAESPEIAVAEEGVAGTPEYMSPEQVRGSEVSARSDVYACGICLYELVAGRPPFLADNAVAVLLKQIEEAPRPPSHHVKGLDPLLEEIILRAIQKDPSMRQQSARELRGELKELLEGTKDDWVVHSGIHPPQRVLRIEEASTDFGAFFVAFASAVLKAGAFEHGHESAQKAVKELCARVHATLRGRTELSFARRDAPDIGFVVVSSTGETTDLHHLIGGEAYGTYGYPFIEVMVKKGMTAITLREGIPDIELAALIEVLSSHRGSAALRSELLARPLVFASVLFAADVLWREAKPTWKVSFSLSRLSRELKVLSNVRGLSLKRLREVRDERVRDAARLLGTGIEVAEFLEHASRVDDEVVNLRGFPDFHAGPLLIEHLSHEVCAEGAIEVCGRLDAKPSGTPPATLRTFANRLLLERSPRSDAALAALYQRGIVVDEDLPGDLLDRVRAEALAESLVRRPADVLGPLETIADAETYARELATLEVAMTVLARRAEAPALLAIFDMLARVSRVTGAPTGREPPSLAALKVMLDWQRLVPVARALLSGTASNDVAATQLLVYAGSMGAHALFVARESLTDAEARRRFVRAIRDTGHSGYALLTAVLPRMDVQREADALMVQDLLHAVPDRQDPALGDTVRRFLLHPKLRPAALSALARLWGERAHKTLVEALESADDAARLAAMGELRRLAKVNDPALAVLERLVHAKSGASEEIRVAAAQTLGEAVPTARPRVVAFLIKVIEGKRGLMAKLIGDGSVDDSVAVLEALARSLAHLDRTEARRVLTARAFKSQGPLRARLEKVLASV